MTGLIWFVQIVHYPLMGVVPADAGPLYAREHQRRTGWVVGPVMLLEAGAALLLVWWTHHESARMTLAWSGLALLALIWVSTAGVQVPLHAKLAQGFDRAVWQQLVATNWVRTVAWTVRGILALVVLW